MNNINIGKDQIFFDQKLSNNLKILFKNSLKNLSKELADSLFMFELDFIKKNNISSNELDIFFNHSNEFSQNLDKLLTLSFNLIVSEFDNIIDKHSKLSMFDDDTLKIK